MKNLAYTTFCIVFWSIVLMALGTAAAVSFYFLYTA